MLMERPTVGADRPGDLPMALAPQPAHLPDVAERFVNFVEDVGRLHEEFGAWLQAEGGPHVFAHFTERFWPAFEEHVEEASRGLVAAQIGRTEQS